MARCNPLLLLLFFETMFALLEMRPRRHKFALQIFPLKVYSQDTFLLRLRKTRLCAGSNVICAEEDATVLLVENDFPVKVQRKRRIPFCLKMNMSKNLKKIE